MIVDLAAVVGELPAVVGELAVPGLATVTVELVAVLRPQPRPTSFPAPGLRAPWLSAYGFRCIVKYALTCTDPCPRNRVPLATRPTRIPCLRLLSVIGTRSADVRIAA